MANNSVMIIADYTNAHPITLEELCEACSVTHEFVHILIEHDVIHVKSPEPTQWVFTEKELDRIKTALRLHRDLEVNMEAMKLVLDLISEINDLRAESNLIRRHFASL